jgi:hypothetical protein
LDCVLLLLLLLLLLQEARGCRWLLMCVLVCRRFHTIVSVTVCLFGLPAAAAAAGWAISSTYGSVL